MSIAANIQKIRAELPESVILVAVSKTRTVEEIQEAYDAGHRVFGENRVQELIAKAAILPSDIQWHLIGHLQSNKVKSLLPFVRLIHSVDSLKLLAVIDREAAKQNKIVSCLLQFHIATEETKFGLNIREALELLGSHDFSLMKNIRLKGVMGMASFSQDTNQVRNEFRSLSQIYQQLKQEFFSGDGGFSVLSMGMSSDYLLAVEEGSNMVRIGTNIFGER
ncbi:MAG: YggS family pyridoxal phosphate-dependent enzyme [Bacteroidales bacterium]